MIESPEPSDAQMEAFLEDWKERKYHENLIQMGRRMAVEEARQDILAVAEIREVNRIHRGQEWAKMILRL